MLRSILYDILDQKESFLFHFQPEHRKYQALLQERSHSDLVEWHYESLKKVLLSLQHHPRVERLYLIIDAVDESDNKDRRNILQLLFNLCLEPKDCVVKVFVASRPVKELEHRISQFHNFIRMQDQTKPDISRFAHSCLKDLNFTSFLDRATKYIVEHAQGVFLWVQLVIEELQGYAEAGPIENDIFEFLRSLPTELEDFYKRILDKLGSNERDLRDGIKLFRFVLFARRPLTVAELRHTLGIQDNPNTEFTPSDEDFQRRIPPKPAIVLRSHTGDGRYGIDPMEQRIIHCGGNFLEVKQDHGIIASYEESSNSIANNPVGSSSVQVMHQTVREFFLRPNGYAADSKFKMSEKDAHISISITCIRYLMLCAANTTMTNKHLDIKYWTSKHFELCAQYLNEMPLTNYVLSHIKHHIADSCQDANILRLVSQFVEELTGSPAAYLLESWVREHLNKTVPGQELGEAAKGFRNELLLVAARMRFPRVAEVSLIAGAQVEACLKGKTPLIISAEMGDDTTVRLLLEKGANVYAKDSNGWTAVFWSAGKGHEAVVRLLLEHNAKVDSKLSNGRTALHWAAKNGHEAVVRLLLDHNAEINAKDSNGRTALHWAAENGHEGVVLLLLDHNAVVDAKLRNGRTALHWAAKNGHGAVAQLLLEHNANVDAKDNNRHTALHWAAKDGHEAVVRPLLDHNADVDATDNNGQTALHWAAKNRHEAVVQALLDHNADVDAKDNSRHTALHWAAENRHEAVVQLLQRL
jgi:ankyrin repeat domain-containing protein 50